MNIIEALEEKLKDPERLERVRRAVFQLQRRQFIWAGDRGTAGLYEAVVNMGVLERIEEWFELSGMTLYHNTSEQWVGLIPEPDFVELMPDERLTAEETIVLLLLSLTWSEGPTKGTIGHRGVVNTTADQLLVQLADLTGKERIKGARLKEILKEFARRSIVALGDEDPVTLDVEIEIRPMVTQVTGNDQLRRLAQFAAAGTAAIPEPSSETADAAADDNSEDSAEENAPEVAIPANA